MQMEYQYKRFIALSVFLITLLAACKKDKSDFSYDNRPVTGNRKGSNVRIVNLGGYNQVVANGDTLTNFLVLDPRSPNYGKYPGTSYFPEDGRLGKTWTVPQDIFNKQENATLLLASRSYQGLGDQDATIAVKNDYNNPMDYYTLPIFYMEGHPNAVVPVPRGVTAPSKPDHFKIRIVNLSGAIRVPVFNSNGQQEKLEGPVSLAYADGTLVSAATSNVSTTAIASDYVELPYGTYQFRVLTQDGRQVPSPAPSSEVYDYGIIDPPTSTIAITMYKSSNLSYAPIQTYMPGGIYTLVVAPQQFSYFINEVQETSSLVQNSFQVIADNSAPANVTYCRVNVVNALQEKPVSFRANGQLLQGSFSFGQSGEYSPLVSGQYTIEAMDASGSTIASVKQDLRAAQNYTAWLYSDASGAVPKLLLVANDLSGSWYRRGSEDDASLDRYQYRYFFYKRFLNFSPDNPYITFTKNNGQTASGSIATGAPDVNLQPGKPLYEQPYIRGMYDQAPYEVMAYRSSPDVVPGIWASDIPVLSGQDFIVRKELYQTGGRALPAQDPGVYTVALIGWSGSNVPAALKSRMIVVKHNR